jgi:hypothetical protein
MVAMDIPEILWVQVVVAAVTTVVVAPVRECLQLVDRVMWVVLRHQLLLQAMHQCPILPAGIWSADQEMDL